VLLDKLRVEALSNLPDDLNVRLSVYAARELHDAALSSLAFGHIPPPRLSCLRTLQAPWVRKCYHEDCCSLGSTVCRGNTLEYRGPDIWLVLSHYKNKAKWDGKVVQFRLPVLLRDVLNLYLLRGHPVLSPGCPYVFVDLKSRPMVQPSQLSFYWEGLLRRCGARAIFPPNQ
jgi:hypothetical protein